MVRGDSRLSNLGLRGMEAHTFLCLEEGARGGGGGVGGLGFHVKRKHSKVFEFFLTDECVSDSNRQELYYPDVSNLQLHHQ